ncbi:hypothetical protein [Bdellovibrio sp. HCB209]|uniref:hypothetical protein n=1 Tax=Bdellovibrio sp. HCB209 TaxID=3394354 RepID=UPI0039B6CA9A
MQITTETFEAMIVLLYKIEEYDACDALLQVFRKIHAESKQPPTFKVERKSDETIH